MLAVYKAAASCALSSLDQLCGNLVSYTFPSLQIILSHVTGVRWLCNCACCCLCRLAADAYKEQLHQAIAAVQREYGLAEPGSDHNVFRWQHRPDVRTISDIMCKYIKDWDYNQVGLGLQAVTVHFTSDQVLQLLPSIGLYTSSKGKASGTHVIKLPPDVLSLPVVGA